VRASSCVFLLFLWTAAAASAQVTTVTTQPAAPTSSAPVTIVLSNPCGCPWYGSGIVRNGANFDVPYGDACLSACMPTTTTYSVGLLPEGTYTVRQFLESDPATTEAIGSFVVGPGAAVAVPALGGGGLALLALLLAASALLVLRRL